MGKGPAIPGASAPAPGSGGAYCPGFSIGASLPALFRSSRSSAVSQGSAARAGPGARTVYSVGGHGIGRRPINTAFKRGQHNVIDLASRGQTERRRLVERLFGEHAHALRVFLKGRLVPPDEIEDLVQELFARLMNVKRLEEKMSTSSGSNRSYLLTMANNMVVDLQRKASIRSNYAARQKGVASDHIDERTPEEIVAAQLELEAMRAVIMAMRPTWRQAFVLHRFRNMSYEDIALHMGMTVKQVENCIAQAMKRIRKARHKIESAGQGKS